MFRTAHLTTSRPLGRALRAAALGGLVLALSGCATIRDSRANPFNWFAGEAPALERAETDADGAESETAGAAPAEVNPLIPQRRESIFRNDDAEVYRGTRVPEVTGLAVDAVPGGAVIRATGTAASLGAFDVRLTAVETGDPSLLRLELRALQPAATAGEGTARARTVTAALGLTDQALAQVRRIEVVARDNARSVRR